MHNHVITYVLTCVAAVATNTQYIKLSSFSHPSLESCIASYDHRISSSLDGNFFGSLMNFS